jgi:hypothetical protein
MAAQARSLHPAALAAGIYHADSVSRWFFVACIPAILLVRATAATVGDPTTIYVAGTAIYVAGTASGGSCSRSEVDW